jgi:Protein of unknown function (DUF3307)
MQTQILIGLFICHFLADYTHLSTAWMLNAKRLGKPFYPIFCHALVHAFIMGLFLKLHFYFTKTVYNPFNFEFTIIDKLFLFQLITHFLIDVWKGRMNGWFPALQSPANKWHWVVFGFDQLLHAIVIIIMTYYAVS